MFEFYVAGVQHHEIYKCLKEIKQNDFLAVVVETREEVLKYDRNAIRLEYSSSHELATDNVMIGFVPAKISAEVSAMIEIWDNITCQIIELNKDEKPWKQVKVVVKEGESDENLLR